MATLKGQNFRVLVNQGGSAWKVVAMSTSCSITMTANTEEATHKDIVGMANLPVITSKAWSVNVESLDITDMALLLQKIKNTDTFLLQWQETSPTDNQTVTNFTAYLPCQGTAYLTDATFTFNDRENSAKSMQFTGSGPIEPVNTAPTVTVITPSMNFTKGQHVRLFIHEHEETYSVIAAAKQLSFHASLTVQNVTTKDTDTDWIVQEPASLSYDITTNALVKSDETITSEVPGVTWKNMVNSFHSNPQISWSIAWADGANNRTKGDPFVLGEAIITQMVTNAPNRQNADYTATLTGVGAFEVGRV